jgi:hypothetical protein
MIAQLPGAQQALAFLARLTGGLHQLYEIEAPYTRGFVFKDNASLSYGNNVDFSPIAFPFPSRQVSVINRPTSAGALLISLFDSQRSSILSGGRGITIEVGQEMNIPIVAFYFQVQAADANNVLLNYEVRGYH